MAAIVTTPYPDTLRAMTLHFPYAWAIVQGFKTEEYRSKRTHYRGVFLIHASGNEDWDFVLDDYEVYPQQIVRKAIIGAVELVDCQDRGDHFAYILKSPMAFEKPIHALGQQSVFWKASTPERVEAFRQAWDIIQPETVIDPETQRAWFF